MSVETTLITLARRLDRRTLMGRALVSGFAAAGSLLLQAPKEALACGGCSACAGNWCGCGNCNSNGSCSGKNCNSYTSCGYPSGGCWTIDNSGGKMCCDCSGSCGGGSPCTCRPRGFGC